MTKYSVEQIRAVANRIKNCKVPFFAEDVEDAANILHALADAKDKKNAEKKAYHASKKNGK